MAEIGMRQLVPHDEGELRIRACGSQYAGRNHDAIVGRECTDAGIDLKLDGNSAGHHWNNCAHLIGAVSPDQDLDRPLAIVPHIAADPSGRAVTRDWLIIESQKLVANFDPCDRSR